MQTATRTRNLTAAVVLGCAVMFLVLDGGARLLAPWLDRTWGALTVTAAMLGVALAWEARVLSHAPGAALRQLGWVRSDPGTLVLAVLLVAAMLAFFPVFAIVTGAEVGLRADWLWVLVGAVALNGIAEETLFRGFVFGQLRRAGRSFGQAALTSLAIFAAVHLALFVGNAFPVALGGVLVALATAYPFAWLFERAGFSIVPPAIVHVGTHFVRLFEFSEPFSMTAVLTWMAFQILLLLSVYAIGSRVDRRSR